MRGICRDMGLFRETPHWLDTVRQRKYIMSTEEQTQRGTKCGAVDREITMAPSHEDQLRGDQVRLLARIAGISIAEEEVAEVANRFQSLMQELDRLRELDLSGIQPVTVFPEEE